VKFRVRDIAFRLLPGGVQLALGDDAGCENTKYCDPLVHTNCTRCTDDPTKCHTQGSMPAFACFESDEILVGPEVIQLVVDPDSAQIPGLAELRVRLGERLQRIAAERKATTDSLPTALAELDRLEVEHKEALDRLRERRATLVSSRSEGNDDRG
jgi:hypothetical protein